MNNQIIIAHDSKWDKEIAYVSHVVFSEWLGISYQIEQRDTGGHYEFSFRNGKKLLAANDLLSRENILVPRAMPTREDVKDISALKGVFYKNEVPVVYGYDMKKDIEDHVSYCEIDLLGSIFFFISRLEEVVIEDKDNHNRFDTKASWAYKRGMLDRPVVNEYIEILWTILKECDDTLQRRERTYKVYLSHDIDHPYIKDQSVVSNLKKVAGDIVSRRSIEMATHRIKAITGDVAVDPHFSFDYIMDVSDAHGIKSAFNFMPSRGIKGIDGDYDVDDSNLRQAIKNIHTRGHEIGVHPTYYTYNSSKKLSEEVQRFKDVMKNNHIAQEKYGGRQHYLRWENPITWQLWQDAGLDYDSTLGWSNYTGFRSGVCYEYSVFNLKTRVHLALKERPLIFMDVNAWRETDHFLDLMVSYVEKVKFFKGDMTMLYHNNYLVTQEQRSNYEELVEVLSAS